MYIIRYQILGIGILVSVLFVSFAMSINLNYISISLIGTAIVATVTSLVVAIKTDEFTREYKKIYDTIFKISIIILFSACFLFISYGAFEMYQLQVEWDSDIGEFRQYISRELAKYQ